MARRFLLLPLLLALLLVAVFGTGLQCVLGTVSSVVDGDTFDVRVDFPVGWGDDCPVAAGQQYRIRLIGVDTPEVYGQAECYGQEASDYAKSVMSGKAVCLMRDTSCTDPYGRLLAYVWVDTDPSTPGCELFLNGDLAWQGFGNAEAYPPDTLLLPSIQNSECEAYKAGRGMWAACPGLPAPAGCAVPPAPPPPATTLYRGTHSGGGTVVLRVSADGRTLEQFLAKGFCNDAGKSLGGMEPLNVLNGQFYWESPFQDRYRVVSGTLTGLGEASGTISYHDQYGCHRDNLTWTASAE